MIGKNLKHKPHQKITKLINEGQTAFSDLVIEPYLLSLANEEYERVHQLLESKDKEMFNNPSFDVLIKRLYQMRNQIISRESKHQEILIELAVEIISEIYDIPEDKIKWNVNFTLEGFIDPSDDQDVNDLEIDPKRLPYLQEEVRKRVMLNALVHGSSMHIYKSCFHMASRELRKLSPILPTLYESYTAVIGFLMWQSLPDDLQNAMENGTLLSQGINSLKFEEDEETEIVVEAINFPAMLHEVNKGVIDLIVCHGLPDDVTEDELKYIYAIADKYIDEYWHYIISPSLWTRLIKHLKLETQKLPDAIMKISLLELSEIEKVFVSLGKDSDFTNNLLKSYHVI